MGCVCVWKKFSWEYICVVFGGYGFWEFEWMRWKGGMWCGIGLLDIYFDSLFNLFDCFGDEKIIFFVVWIWK